MCAREGRGSGVNCPAAAPVGNNSRSLGAQQQPWPRPYGGALPEPQTLELRATFSSPLPSPLLLPPLDSGLSRSLPPAPRAHQSPGLRFLALSPPNPRHLPDRDLGHMQPHLSAQTHRCHPPLSPGASSRSQWAGCSSQTPASHHLLHPAGSAGPSQESTFPLFPVLSLHQPRPIYLLTPLSTSTLPLSHLFPTCSQTVFL